MDISGGKEGKLFLQVTIPQDKQVRIEPPRWAIKGIMVKSGQDKGKQR
jgi:hypothetical protein